MNMKGNDSLTYSSYLNIDDLLKSQHLESQKSNSSPAHEEMLFVIIHQTYELWFKQILWEMDSIIEIFKKDSVSDSQLYKINHRLHRISEIQRLLIQQIDVLETMTPLEFLEFRDLLFSASGFQSSQFRMIENKMGLRSQDRAIMGECPYHKFLEPSMKDQIIQAESSTTLFSGVERWLERTPYVQDKNYDFWTSYTHSVNKMFDLEIQNLQKFIVNKKDLAISLEKIEKERTQFQSIINEKTYNEYRNKNLWRLSHKALMAALFIQLYQEHSKLHGAFQLITYLIEIDERWTMWRYRHAQMVNRMLGQKVGTGGSSGAEYLKKATEAHRVFSDFFKLVTFFLPSSHLPPAPTVLSK